MDCPEAQFRRRADAAPCRRRSGVLCLIAKRRTGRDVDQSVGAKREPGSARAVVPVAYEEILDVREGFAVELAARQHDRALTLLRVSRALTSPALL